MFHICALKYIYTMYQTNECISVTCFIIYYSHICSGGYYDHHHGVTQEYKHYTNNDTPDEGRRSDKKHFIFSFYTGECIWDWFHYIYLFSRLYDVSTSSCAHLTIILSSSSICLCHSSLLPLIPFPSSVL